MVLLLTGALPYVNNSAPWESTAEGILRGFDDALLEEKRNGGRSSMVEH